MNSRPFGWAAFRWHMAAAAREVRSRANTGCSTRVCAARAGFTLRRETKRAAGDHAGPVNVATERACRVHARSTK